MKRSETAYRRITAEVPEVIRREVDMSFDISQKIDTLMKEREMSVKDLASALGKSPSIIAKWLSGQYNFSLSNIAALSAFFGKEIIDIKQ